jgi:hypothetical protein
VVAGRPYYTVGGTLPLEREPQSNLNTGLDAATQEASPTNAGPSRDGGAPRRLPTGDAGAGSVR